MTNPDLERDPAERGERGFILVGVVMFMLALTILGLSLFALSSYEAQFFYMDVSREQSLHRSESGLEIVKTLLTDPTRTARLEDARLAVGQFGITSALAYQWRSPNPNDTTSRGLVNWDSTLVLVVTSRSGNQERKVQSRYQPVAVRNPYKMLVSAGLGVFYNTLNSSSRNVELRGKLWQRVSTSSDTAWLRQVNWTTGRPLDASTAPEPQGNAFVDSKLPGASDPTSWDEDRFELAFRNSGSSPRYFKSPRSPQSAEGRSEFDQYTFFSDGSTTINVRGTCVWVVPQGVCFRQRVFVQPDGPGGTLVIVAKANGRDPGYENRGIWFQSGLIVNNPSSMKVFLVSEGDIGITYLRNSTESRDAQALSMVAGGDIELMGPSNGYTFKLYHDSNMDALADDLVARGALPPTTGGSGTAFAYVGSSWKELRLP